MYNFPLAKLHQGEREKDLERNCALEVGRKVGRLLEQVTKERVALIVERLTMTTTMQQLMMQLIGYRKHFQLCRVPSLTASRG